MGTYSALGQAQALTQVHTTLLGAGPAPQGLQQAVRQMVAYLQVRQTALVLFASTGPMTVVVLRVSLPTLTGAMVAQWQALTEVVHARQLPTAPPWAEWGVPLRMRGETLGLWWVAARAPDGGYADWQRNFLQAVGPSLALAAQAWLLFEASQAVARNLLQARETERFKVALELHDMPLQELAVVGQRLGQLAPQLSAPLASEALTCQTLVRGLSERLRAICQGLRPPVLARGVSYAVTEAVAKFRQATGLRVRLQLKLPDLWVPSEAVTTAAYHITTEALNNVRKHAQARWVLVRVVLHEGRLRLTIADNGQGLWAAHFGLVDWVQRGHLGLVGMHEWARLAGGTLRVQPRTGGGTEVLFEVGMA